MTEATNFLVVLGGGRDKTPQGDLTPLSLQRLESAVNKFSELPEPRKIICLGGNQSTFRPNAITYLQNGADQKADFFRSHRISETDLLLFPYGGDTILEAFATMLAIRQKPVHQIVVVTSAEHLDRTSLNFHQAANRILPTTPKIDVTGPSSHGLMNPKLEKQIFNLTKSFWQKLPQNDIPTPENWHHWYTFHSDFYAQQEAIISQFKPQQAYNGIKTP